MNGFPGLYWTAHSGCSFHNRDFLPIRNGASHSPALNPASCIRSTSHLSPCGNLPFTSSQSPMSACPPSSTCTSSTASAYRPLRLSSSRFASTASSLTPSQYWYQEPDPAPQSALRPP